MAKTILISGLFDEEWYGNKYPDALKKSENLIDHFIKSGDQLGYCPNQYFDPDWYRAQAPGARKPGINSLVHYITVGWQRGRDPSTLFSGKLYFEQYPEIEQNKVSPLEHYFKIGRHTDKLAFAKKLEHVKNGSQLIKEMRTIHKSGLFQARWYKQFYTDLWQLNIDPLYHFVTIGQQQNRQPNPIFQTEWYKVYNADSIGNESALVHYIQAPKKKFDPAPDFNNAQYFVSNPKLNIAKDDPLAHYLANGMLHGEEKPQRTEIHSAETSNKKKKSKKNKPKLPLPQRLRGMLDYPKTPLAPETNTFDSNRLNIHWVIPDFVAGGGGHMTIFRMASFLERAGHNQTIWINEPGVHATEEQAADDILKHFQQFTGSVKFLDDSFKASKGDAIIATDCWTVWPVLSASNFKRRFYFVQDFEPSFHPMGSDYLAAEQTYNEDLDCICASPWLSKLMSEKYGRWARPFWLAADTELYHPLAKKQKNKRPRIAFYARHFTARRAVELGMLALEELANRKVDFEVDFFGAPIEFKEAPFKFKDHGVASPEELATIFQKADLGVVFSATNYSLVPQEMMACGLPIVEMKGESTECIFPADTVSLAAPHPAKIADALEALIKDETKRLEQAEAANKWVNSFSWKASAELVENALLDRLTEFATDIKSDKKTARQTPKASVVIPTLNAGPILDRVLEAAVNQQTPWPFEILVIDSGSTDGTLDTIAKYPSVKLHQIDKKNFNHGGTRNLGAELTTGEFIAYLTHDALPANERWLYNLVSSIEMHPDAAGAYGKHLPYPEATAFTQRDLNAHFDLMAMQPLCVNKETNKKRYDAEDVQWRQFLHFYSDNNSCFRRSVWEKIPYRETKFGEDQVWADDIIKAGYSKVYAVRAVVYHSHDFNPEENQERSMTEAAFFKHFFGYKLIGTEKEFTNTLKDLNAHDKNWGKENGISEDIIEDRMLQNEARLRGYLEGYLSDTSKMF